MSECMVALPIVSVGGWPQPALGPLATPEPAAPVVPAVPSVPAAPVVPDAPVVPAAPVAPAAPAIGAPVPAAPVVPTWPLPHPSKMSAPASEILDKTVISLPMAGGAEIR